MGCFGKFFGKFQGFYFEEKGNRISQGELFEYYFFCEKNMQVKPFDKEEINGLKEEIREVKILTERAWLLKQLGLDKEAN